LKLSTPREQHTYIQYQEAFDILDVYLNLDFLMLWMHGSILVAYMYLFQFKFENVCRNSTNQATTLYVHSPLLKTPFMF
jgi:hypothetical protein